MIVFNIIITLPFLVLGICLVIFYKTIAAHTFFEISPGKSTSSILGKLLVKNKIDPTIDNTGKLRGEFVYSWFLRIFGVIVVLICLGSIVLVLVNP
jgi:hypothetical protein